MKTQLSIIILLAFSLISFSSYSQNEVDTALLNLPGDNLDLVTVLELFQNSPSIEEFEKSLNDEEKGINNLDLNLDEKVDFIKVNTTQNDNDFIFVLQVDIDEKEKQDVAVIFVSKDKEKNISMQIVGNETLYGKKYIIEPAPTAPVVPTLSRTTGYTGTEHHVV